MVIEGIEPGSTGSLLQDTDHMASVLYVPPEFSLWELPSLPKEVFKRYD